MARQNLLARHSLQSGVEIDQPNDPAMRMAEGNRKCPEILVERDQNALFAERYFHDGAVPGISAPVAGPDDVVALCRKRVPRARRNAGIQQQLQVGKPTNAGSTRSLPTSRRA